MPSIKPRLSPLWMLADLAGAVGTQWRELPESDRDRARELLAKSKGRPSNLSKRERDEVAQIVRRLDLRRLALDMVPRLGRRRP